MTTDLLTTPPVRGLFRHLDIPLDDPIVTTVLPAVARGTGAVIAVPPSPAWAAVAVAASASRFDDRDGRIALLLSPEALLPGWTPLAAQFAAHGIAVVIGATSAGARRLLETNSPDVLVTTPAIARWLVARSAVPLERLGATLIAWPELMSADAGLDELLPAFPRETARLVLTSELVDQASFIERHAWRAPVTGPLADRGASAAPVALRVALSGWESRIASLLALADLAATAELVVWVAHQGEKDAITQALTSRGVRTQVVSGPELPDGHAVALDAPPPSVLTDLTKRGGVAVMAPGTESYFRRWAPRLEPVALPIGVGRVGGVAEQVAAERDRIRHQIDSADLRASVLTLAPMFEEYPASIVAAAVHTMWRDAQASGPARSTSPTPSAGGKVWASAGRKDGASVADWLTFLTETIGVPRDHFGRLDLRETYTLIESRGPIDAERLAELLAGQSFMQRRLSARVDRGPERKPARRPGGGPPSRRPS